MPPGTGPVATAARRALAKIRSDHAASPLLAAMAQRLARDVDEAEKVPERIAAVRMVMELVNVLDGAMLGLGSTPDLPPEDDGDDDDDIFEIGDVPPGVGDGPEPGAPDVGAEGR